MKKEQVAIIIPIYNLWKEMTLPCLESLAQHTLLDQIHIYLIDNASSDVDAEQILRVGNNLFADKFTYHRFEENKGFAIACNMGATLAHQNGDEYIFLLNNDTLVTPNWLSPLLVALDEPKIGAVGPLLLYPKNQRVQHCGVSVNPFGGLGHIYRDFPANHPLVLKKRYLQYITGAAFLIRTKLFIEVGMLCEEYLNGYEDIDLCCRIGSKDYFVRVVPESVFYHYESQSEGRYDAEAKNSDILKSHHPMLMRDDPYIAKKDGYIPSLTKELKYFRALPREKADQYTKNLNSHFSLQSCRKLLEKEPLWVEGYEILAKYYDEQNMGDDVCGLREIAVRCRPTSGNYLRLISSLLKYEKEERAKLFQERLDNIMGKMTDISYQKGIGKYFESLSQIDPIYRDIYNSRLHDVEG